MIQCPSCQTHLFREKSPEGVFWRCPGCEGRLLAVPVARKLLDKKLVNGLWIASGDFTLDRKRECPLCKNLMIETLTSPTEHPVHVDVCRACHYIWFDTYELSHLAATAPVKPEDIPADVKEKRMPERAREMIAVFEVERMRKKADAEDMVQGTPPEDSWQTLFTVLGLPVEEGTAPLQRMPIVTWVLAALMVLVFALTYRHLNHWIQEWGLIPDQALRHHGLTWLSSIFLHADFWHLLGNVYFFLIFADNVEDYLGKFKFLLLFFLAAAAGGALHIAFDARSNLPCVGASGAISSILAFYALQFPKAKICLLISLKFYFRWVRLPAWGAFLLWCLLQAVLLIEQLQGISHISALAHSGGVAIGVLFGLIHRFRSKDTEVRRPTS